MTDISKKELCHMIPHTGDMCLIDQVDYWDKSIIRCQSNTHRRPDNPLRSANRLHVVAGVEYAAQAMAIHGGLVDQKPLAGGYLASVRDLVFGAQSLDDLDGPLQIEAVCLNRDSNGLIYKFAMHNNNQEVLSGRASVFLNKQEMLV
jgi:predicted hotdog family 3-hydroxylacyl-ACP dehydratase